MIKIGITGIEGLIGWHLRAFLNGVQDVEVLGANRATFADQSKLNQFASSCDVIVHLAGMNRGDEQEVANTNVALTEQLVSACRQAEKSPHIIFSSSTHIYKDTFYGRSKKSCAEKLQDWADSTDGLFTNLVLPHVFGEGGKPFYNSATSTFCYQLANGQTPTVIQDGSLELLHAQDVAVKIFDIARSSAKGELTVSGTPITVGHLLEKLKGYAGLYGAGVIPDLDDPFERNLFNTYRHYLFPGRYPVMGVLHQDNRGCLFETVKSLSGGQSFVSTTKPGITRGNHYHLRKVERFFVLKGKAEIRIRKMFSNDVFDFIIDGRQPQYVDIPTLHTHNITNTGDEDLLTLFWADEIFDPRNPDTFAEPV